MSEISKNNTTKSFADLGLSDELLQAVKKVGYSSPSCSRYRFSIC